MPDRRTLRKIAFQSTLPRRERRKGTQHIHKSFKISIHAPAKGATFCGNSAVHGTRNFNPRSREGSDVFPCYPFPIKKRFQSTLPRRERPSAFVGCCFAFDFNPRSREGSDNSRGFVSYTRLISIHAPAKGATQYQWVGMTVFVISIHAPAKGATAAEHWSVDKILHFNPRSREGSDMKVLASGGIA